jgi:hypothetical protein
MEHHDMELKFNTIYEEKDKVHVATCIEMGLVATADRKEDLPAIMDKLINRQVRFALENDNLQDMFHPAELAYQFLREAMAKEKAKDVRRTESAERVDGAPVNVINIAYAVNC